MKLFSYLLLLLLYLAGLVYLSLPQPEIIPPPGALRSTEPGDTWQNPDQQAYYTNLSRDQVLDHFQDTFALKLFGHTLPSYRLNYPPEDTRVYIRDHLLAYYLEEINHPLRESLFVAGWNPRLSPISDYLFESQFDRWAIIVDGVEYQSKLTLKPYFSSPYIRFFIWTSIFPLTYLAITQFLKSTKNLYLSLKKNQ